MNVLVVEDDPGMSRFINTLLADYRTEFAGSVAETVQRLEKNSYDVILLDLNLPNGRGLATIKRLRTVAKKTPFVILTGDDCDQMELDCFKEGVQGYMRKRDLAIGPELPRMIYHAHLRQKARDEVHEQVDEYQQRIRVTVESMENSLDVE